jgi:hypothetical protein
MKKIVSFALLGLFCGSFSFADIPAPPPADSTSLSDFVQKMGTSAGSGMGSTMFELSNVSCSYKANLKPTSAKCKYGKNNTVTGKIAWALMQDLLKATGKEAKCSPKKVCAFENAPLNVVCRYPLEEGGAAPSCNVEESKLAHVCPNPAAPVCKLNQTRISEKDHHGCTVLKCVTNPNIKPTDGSGTSDAGDK